MGNVRELMARLGPSTVKFDTGRGGTPDLTNQDIAAALGMVPAGLGRELLEALWWPESGARRMQQLRQAVIALMAPEFTRQQKALAEARTELGIAKTCMGWGGGTVTDMQRKEFLRAEAKLEATRALSWPNNTMEQLGTLAGAVITELANAGCCNQCEGRGSTPHRGGAVECDGCDGSGIEPMSGRQRALAIGSDQSAYRRFWRPVYEWMLERLREAESDAAHALRMALGRAA
ncbi:hypothetical protein [Stenotrophomonas sp. NPDC078853]|uniref:hypothetical protein n=1 Tax=Stenotrophomonas sp. NPDC078853 TaxID=3364534 RepID=UPI00384F0C13